MVELDFNITCPIIDDSLLYIEQGVEGELKSLIEEIQPNLGEKHKENLVSEYLDKIFKDILTPGFEKVRETNSNMRDSANRQLKELSDELEDTTDLYEELKNELDD